jgi:hypothetical protein
VLNAPNKGTISHTVYSKLHRADDNINPKIPTTKMLSQTVPVSYPYTLAIPLSLTSSLQTIVPQHQANLPIPEEVKDRAYVSTYNENDYSDFLYLAPPLTAGFLPLEAKVTETAAALSTKKASIRPTETRNTGTTPPPVSPAQGFEKEYFQATFPPSGQRTPIPEEGQAAAERRERRPSFVEVTPVKVHHGHDTQKDAHKQKRHSHSSHSSEPMNWWPDNEASAQHEWVERGAEEGDVIEEEVWSDAFYE